MGSVSRHRRAVPSRFQAARVASAGVPTRSGGVVARGDAGGGVLEASPTSGRGTRRAAGPGHNLAVVWLPVVCFMVSKKLGEEA